MNFASDAEMLKQIMEDTRSMRIRLDTYIHLQANRDLEIYKETSRIREEMAGYKTKLTMLASGIAIFVTALINIIIDEFKR